VGYAELMNRNTSRQSFTGAGQSSPRGSSNPKDRKHVDDSAVSDTQWLVFPGLMESFEKFIKIADRYLNNEDNKNNRPLIIIGESGSGKSLFIEAAKQIYKCNNENKGSIVRVNCASFDSDVADSELFGHVKGAFTDAIEGKAGIVEEAENGLLILDEIGELPKSVQAKLLIFIEEGTFRRVGENRSIPLKLKIIGTTNKKQNDFREDFWYRFFPFFVPALHERRLDVLYYMIIEYKNLFRNLHCHYAMSLLAHHWPGNTRELERVFYLMKNRLFQSYQRYAYDHGDVTTPLTGYLPFPVDSRETSLVSSDFVNFCDKINKSDIDLVSFNEITEKYGLAFPIIFRTPNDYDNTLEKILKKKSLDKQNVESEDKQTDEKETLKEKTPDIYAQRVPSMMLTFQHTLNSKSNFYNELSKDIVLRKIESGFENIYIILENKEIESIGSCFSALAKLFLRNDKVNENVFSFSKIDPGESLWDNAVECDVFKKLNKRKFISKCLSVVLKEDVYSGWFTFAVSWRYLVDLLLNDLKTNAGKNDDMPVDVYSIYNFYNKNTTKSLLLGYYVFLIKKYKTKKEAAEHADVKYSKFLFDLKKLGYCDEIDEENDDHLDTE
jgi:transcriptional regulator with AAA-type ATPase domain